MWEEILGDEFIEVPRLSRIHYNGKFFHYPLKAFNAITGLGLAEAVRIILSYFASRVNPHPAEDNLEQWVTNRFGDRLYRIFFKTYTEKVWGIPCEQLGAQWAAQRIKGLSLLTAVVNMLFKPAGKGQQIKTLMACVSSRSTSRTWTRSS